MTYSATRLTSNMPFTIDKSCYLTYGPVYVFLFELDVQLSWFFFGETPSSVAKERK
jgi:hypothetical protein